MNAKPSINQLKNTCIDLKKNVITMIYNAYDSLTMLVLLMPDGSMKKEVVASISKGLRVGPQFEEELEQLKASIANYKSQITELEAQRYRLCSIPLGEKVKQ